jgi:hypothetical protein
MKKIFNRQPVLPMLGALYSKKKMAYTIILAIAAIN